MPYSLPNEKLNESVVPSTTAPWHVKGEFAITFNGYEIIGQKECGILANTVKRQFAGKVTFLEGLSLTELRTCLFFEQRRFHHFGDEPQGDDRAFVDALLEAIRQRVQARPDPGT